MTDDNPNSPKPNFWTTVPGILTSLTGVLGAIAGIIGALHSVSETKAVKPPTAFVQPAPIPSPVVPQDNPVTPPISKPTKPVLPVPNNRPNPELESISRKLADLQKNKPVCHSNGIDNTWWDFFWDYGNLGQISTDYAKYILKHPPDEATMNKLTTTFYKVKERNAEGVKAFDPGPTHSVTLPDEFEGFLNSLDIPRSDRLPPEDERIFEAGIKNWYVEAGLQDPVETIEAHCKYDKLP
jgi:hypothetical protein